MGSRPTTDAFPEQGSLHNIAETATNRRAARTQKIRQESTEPRQDYVYGPSPPQNYWNTIQIDDNERHDTRAENTLNRILRTSRRNNKRTQDMAELDEPESSTSSTELISRPNKRRATGIEDEDAIPIFILPPPVPPPHRIDSPHPTIRRNTESNTIQDSSTCLQSNSPITTGNNTGGVITLPPISENSTHGGITLPPLRSVLPLGNYTERSRTPENNNEVIDLTTPPSYPSNNAADPHPNNFVDLTSSPVVLPQNTHSSANIISDIKKYSSQEIIIIDDDSSAEDTPPTGLPSPSKGLQLKCAICLDHPKDVSFTPCGHMFCRECITTALKSQRVCSLCRRQLTKKQIKRLEFKILVK